MPYPKKPTALKKFEGNPGKRPLSDDDFIPKGKLGAPPRDLTTGAKKIWVETLKEVPDGMITSADRGEFEIYCTAYDLYKTARAMVKKEGAVVASNTGERSSAWLVVMNKQAEIMTKSASKIGLTPVDRSRIALAQKEKPKDDPFARFLGSANPGLNKSKVN